MSIRAMNWAMEQRTDGPSAQSVLFTIADRANEHGNCRHADPETIAVITRQSRATVFRRLEELERAGVLVRFTRHLDDGRREYEIRLQLGVSVNYKVNKWRDIEHVDDEGATLSVVPFKGETPDDEVKSHPETEGESHPETEPVSPVRLGESHSCDPQKTPSKNPKEENPPNPPSGGGHAAIADDESWKRFVSAWHFPITDLPKALIIWQALTPPEREDAITGAKGYRSYIDGEHRAKRNRAVKDAHRWLRDKLWLGYLNAGKSAEAAAERFEAPENSDEWKAWTVFYRCCGQSGIPQFLILQVGGTRATVPRRWPPVGREFDPASANWETVHEGRGQFAAWLRRLRELPDVRIATRTVLQNGLRVQALVVPSQWPPNRGSTGPPKQPSEQDLDEFANS